MPVQPRYLPDDPPTDSVSEQNEYLSNYVGPGGIWNTQKVQVIERSSKNKGWRAFSSLNEYLADLRRKGIIT